MAALLREGTTRSSRWPARVLVAMGRPVFAMEELQQIRQQWPGSDGAETALEGITLLYRLYLRSQHGPAFAFAEPAGPAQLRDVLSLVTTSGGAAYWATETGIGRALPAEGPPVPPTTRPRALVLDRSGGLAIVEGASLLLANGKRFALIAPRPNGGTEPLDRIVGAAQLSGGDWLVADEGGRAIHRFGPDGSYVGVFAGVRVSALAVSERDQVAGLDRDQRRVVVLDAEGRETQSLALRTSDYNLSNPAGVKFDQFGHLYVLDREALAVFRPATATGTVGAPETPVLVTLFSTDGRTAGAFDRARAFTLDRSGAILLYDDRAERILVYR